MRCSVDGGLHLPLAAPFEDVPLCQRHADELHLDLLADHLDEDTEFTLVDGGTVCIYLSGFGQDSRGSPAVICQPPGGGAPEWALPLNRVTVCE
jgi:hypothetical protein